MRLKVCLAIDENLSPDVVVRRAAAQFVQQLQGHADIALYVIGHGNVKLVDYSADPRPILNAIGNLPQRAQGGGNLVESLFELAKTQRTLEGRRAIVVLATHDLDLADGLVTRVALVRDGRLLSDEPAAAGLRARYRAVMGSA